MSWELFKATPRDHKDAHGNLEQDEKYFTALRQKICNRPIVGEEGERASRSRWKFDVVEGIFEQADKDTIDEDYNYSENFGIKKPWDEIKTKIRELNQSCDDNHIYKVLFLARHGEGYHNVASRKYPVEEWLNKWRYLGTDGDLVWGPDPELTDLGINQAKANNKFWREQLENGAPTPSKHYVSPMQRSCQTHHHTWHGIDASSPIVVEKLRETVGINLCNKRSTKSVIQRRFPGYKFEPSFEEEDTLFDSYTTTREELFEQFLRLECFLQELFDNDYNVASDNPHEFIAITSHAGTIRSILTVVGHRKFTIPTGGMIPLVVRATRVEIQDNHKPCLV